MRYKKPYIVKHTDEFGRGLYAARTINKGELIEENTVLQIPSYLHRGIIEKYVFAFGRRGQALALGNISLLNHSSTPNCDYFFTRNDGIDYLHLTALEKICKGEQLFIDYGYEPISRKKAV